MSHSTPVPRRLKWAPILAGLLLVAVVLMVWKPWRPSTEEFMKADPHGYAACNLVDSSRGSGGKTYRGYIDAANAEGAQSTTEAIRAIWDTEARKSPTGPRWGDLTEMDDACKRAGFKFRN